ncbi:hypothetical protein CCR82_09565 [Halochromatium salexigens]|uniref:Uncharacterized protein n=2 Tax=Halochromatium salexigens TaxID=49447 RepID=A0AAJ0UFZ6_HALSE|nr:hypothetical protein [Halochromatium salexigens]
MLLWIPATTNADEAPAEVPDPLSLEQALGFAETHPRVTAAARNAVADGNSTDHNGAADATGTRSSPAMRFDLPRAQPLYLGCHSLAFSGARGNDAERDVSWSGLLGRVAAQRLEIMQRFFDVLLADLSFARDNEAMAVAFIQFDRAEARQELGQFSPLRTAELQADYQRIRRQRAASEAAQRVTRALLATALGHPTSLPRQLITPTLEPAQAEPPELDAIVATALENNPGLRALMQGRGGAEQALVRMAVRERALELLTRLELLDIIAEQTRSESDWRDLKLDESRTLYELEAQADLGFSMSQQTKARRDEREVAFCRALTRAELQALQGLIP